NTLGQALMRFHRYQPLLHTLVPTTFRAEAGVVVLGWSTERRSTVLSDDVLGSGLMRFMKLLTGRNDVKPILMKTLNGPYLSSLLERQAEAMLQALPKQDPLLSDVQQAILSIMQDSAPSMALVAERIGMAERSLYRALEARGTGFKELVRALRFELAKDYLRGSDLTLPNISLLLGFADQSVFTRAFRQWSGTTPLQWRKQI
ncbi:MAG: AraC family transcriptional regulator, partial [Paraperlucidibaca sp.]